MKTAEAIKRAGTAYRLAKLLNITYSAVRQWGENVPTMRVYQMRVLYPEWFLTKD